MWFYSATDHLFDLQIPETLPKSLQTRLKKFQNKVLKWRLPMNEKDYATKRDKLWAINEAKTLLILIDKHFGIKTQKGDWE